MNHGSSGGRRTLAFSPSVATPKPGSVPVPSLAEARAAFGSGAGSLRSSELGDDYRHVSISVHFLGRQRNKDSTILINCILLLYVIYNQSQYLYIKYNSIGYQYIDLL